MTSTISSSAAEAAGPSRLVVTSTSRSWGGMEHYAVEVARGLAARGHAVRFLWSHDVVGERVRDAGLAGARCRLRADGDLAGLLDLARRFRRHRADAVLLTKWREYWLGGLAAWVAGVPRTVIALGLRVEPRGDPKRRIIFRRADRIVVNADEIAEALRARPWIDAGRIRVVHNGVDLRRFAPGGDGRAFRARLGVPDGAPLIGAVGSLTPQKDHDLFVRAVAPLLRERPDLHAVIVGEGFLRPRLEERIAGLGVGDRMHLAGFVEDVRPAMAALDLFVLSSDNEGMAWVLLEALACGLPLVATDVSGTRACVEDGINGMVVPPRREEPLRAAMAVLLGDGARRLEMGLASRRLAEARFDHERMLDGTERLLRD